MDKFSELKAAAMAATPGRIGDRIDGSGSIKYECTGYDGSLVLRTNHKDMEYGFVGDNADADELFFRLCVPDVVLELLAENERVARELVARNGEIEGLKKRAAELDTHNECLLKKNADLTQQNIKLGERLATPVRLPRPGFVTCSGERHYTYGADEVKGAIHAAGFTVEGDE
ncbi:ead/Ea22-like family protein [Serratia marcescens]|uniref:ead/Ea22-like family protein n=1 Tax=Serratia marcescens TaxID=615 RepID=UPI001F198508|nr:ead/Ea22-like family protein [Serratia marcescens]UKG72769.1 ead/Ea22-like family protein [Serratia marcescens]